MAQNPDNRTPIDGRADFATRWQPGKSGNPAGRPTGARNKFSQQFVDAFTKHFAVHGEAAIREVREKDSGAYLKIYASIMPKQLEVAAIQDTRKAEDLTDDELAAIALGETAGLLESPKEVEEGTVSKPKPKRD